MQPDNSQCSRDPIQRHIPISLLLGSTPPPPSGDRALNSIGARDRSFFSTFKALSVDWTMILLLAPGGGGGGVLLYMAYTGMCCWTGFDFWPLCSKQGILFSISLSQIGYIFSCKFVLITTGYCLRDWFDGVDDFVLLSRKQTYCVFALLQLPRNCFEHDGARFVLCPKQGDEI